MSKCVRQLLGNKDYQRYALGSLLGAVGVFAFAPFYIWISIAFPIIAFAWLTYSSAHSKAAFFSGFWVGVGYFASGISWVYVSIATYGQVGDVIALLITLLFISVLAVFWGIGGFLSYRLIRLFPTFSKSFIVTLCLLVAEYLRSHLFTGFPWLLPGYAIEQTWLFTLAPIGGIWLLSFAVILSAVLSYFLIFNQQNRGKEWLVLGSVVVIWLFAGLLHVKPVQWVILTDTIRTTLIQGNLKQDEKWLVEQAAPSLEYYQQETLNNLDSDIVIWPETAITYLYHQVESYLSHFQEALSDSHTSVVTGVPYWDKTLNTYYNGVWAMGEGFGLYFKQRLVPFGEYVPFQNVVGKVLDIFGIPMSSFSAGDKNQPVLQLREWGAAPFICYEIVYPELVRQMVRDSDFLITISNDGWFGDSIGPLQHLQIAQFRAKESGRYVIRATNTGVSAVINSQGEITAKAPQFVRTSLTTNIQAASGITPYVQYGNLILLTLIFFLSTLLLLQTKLSK